MNLPRVLDSNLKEVRRLHPVSLAIDDNLIPLSNATMVIRNNELVEGRTYVKLSTPNGISEIYRTRVPETSAGKGTATIQLEHAVCEIGDYLVQNAINAEYTVRDAFVELFSHYRGNKWQLGTFSASETVVIDCDYDNVLEMMLAVLQQEPKYMMTFDFSTSPWTLSLAEKSNTVMAEGRLSRNVISAQIRKDDKPLCTRVYVKGLPKPAGRESDENAIGYMDADTISTYGVIEKETGGTNLTQAQAERIATAYLNANKNPKQAIELEMLDLSEITGEPLDSIVKGKLFRLVVPDENIVITDYITQISWFDVINDPKHARVKIGDLEDAVIEFMRDQTSAARSSRGGGKRQAKVNESFSQHFELTDEYGEILNKAGMYLDAYGMIVYATDEVYNIGSVIQQTASMIRSEVHAANSTMYSVIEQTASYIQTEVANTQSDLHSLILQTPEMIHSEVGSAVSGFAQSVIEQTATYIRSEVSNAASSISQSVIEQTTEYVRTEVVSVASGVAWSVIEQTMTGIEQRIGSKARVYVQMTQPTGTIYEGDIWVKSTGKRTWNDAATGTWNDASSFRWKDYAGSEMYVYKSGAWVLIGDSAVAAEQEVKIEQDRDHIALIGRRIDTDKEEYNSRLQVTAKEIRSDVSASKSDLYSVIIQTATNVFSGVYDRVGNNFSTIEQTATAIDIGVNSAKSSLYAAINVTSTQIALKVGKDEVISRINLTSESITISSAKVNLEGYVQATDITSEYLKTKISLIDTLNAKKLYVQSSIECSGIYYTSGLIPIHQGVWDVKIVQSGNTYKLQKYAYNGSGWEDCGVSFSRATSLIGDWASGAITITASPQGNTRTISLGVASGQAYKSGNYLYVPVLDGTSFTGYEAWVNWKNLLTSHSNCVGGLTAYNTSAQVELFYKSGESSYRSAGKKYWYYRDTSASLQTYYS